jgi:hypothetical protein
MADSFTPEQIENMNKFFELINSSVAPLTEAQKEELALAKAAKEAGDRLKKFGEQLGKSGIDFTKALFNGTDGFGKFGDSVTSATSAIGDFAGTFGKLGFVVGGVIKVFGDFVDSALKQNDNLLKGFRDLSELGSVTQDGIKGLKADLSSIGLISSEYEKLTGFLKPISQDLVKFGGSVTSGKNALLDVVSNFVGEGNQLELSLTRIGYTSETIREGVADYISMQTRLGKAQGKTTQQLTDESKKYLVEMRGLQELTGMTRDDQQKIRDAQMADARFSLHLSGLERKEAENLQQYMIAYQAAFGAEAAAGLKDRIVNFGAVTTEAGAASYQRGNKEYELSQRAQKEGMAFFQEALVTTAKNTMASLGPLSTTFRLSEGVLKQMGFNAEMVNAALALTNTDQKEFDKRMKAIIATMVKQEDQTETNLKGEQGERAKRLLNDALLAEAAKGLIYIFGILKDVTTGLAKMIANAVDFITANVPTLTPTNLSRFFEESASSSSSSANFKSDPSGSQLSPDEEKQSNAAGAGLAPSMAGRNSNDVLDKLNFDKKRAERTGGGDATPQLLAMAEKIHTAFPGTIITALNDRHHQDYEKGSLHTIGKALDFALPYRPNSVQGGWIAKHLRSLGASNVLDEYNKPTRGSTGGHFHVEVARHGGLFSGKDAGYPVMLHGKNESVWPEKDLKSFMKDVQKTSLEQYKQELMTQIVPGGTTSDTGSKLADAFNMFSNKLDSLISEQRNNNSIQAEILTYSRA